MRKVLRIYFLQKKKIRKKLKEYENEEIQDVIPDIKNIFNDMFKHEKNSNDDAAFEGEVISGSMNKDNHNKVNRSKISLTQNCNGLKAIVEVDSDETKVVEEVSDSIDVVKVNVKNHSSYAKDDNKIKHDWKADKYWNPPKREPSTDEEKSLFAEVIAVVVKILMNNHVYSFGGDLKVQEGNGSIGDRATGIIAQFVMIWWDRQFKAKLKELAVECDLLKRYIDDINGVFSVLAPGTE